MENLTRGLISLPNHTGLTFKRKGELNLIDIGYVYDRTFDMINEIVPIEYSDKEFIVIYDKKQSLAGILPYSIEEYLIRFFPLVTKYYNVDKLIQMYRLCFERLTTPDKVLYTEYDDILLSFIFTSFTDCNITETEVSIKCWIKKLIPSINYKLIHIFLHKECEGLILEILSDYTFINKINLKNISGTLEIHNPDDNTPVIYEIHKEFVPTSKVIQPCDISDVYTLLSKLLISGIPMIGFYLDFFN